MSVQEMSKDFFRIWRKCEKFKNDLAQFNLVIMFKHQIRGRKKEP